MTIHLSHTPGPWKVVDGRDAAGPFTVRAELQKAHGLMGDYQGDIVAEVQQNPSDPLEGLAKVNAHLLAEAPELLKVAKAASHALRSYEYGNASSELAKEVADAIDEVTRRAQTVIRESAQPCGCDPGANWRCSDYPTCAAGRRAQS